MDNRTDFDRYLDTLPTIDDIFAILEGEKEQNPNKEEEKEELKIGK